MTGDVNPVGTDTVLCAASWLLAANIALPVVMPIAAPWLAAAGSTVAAAGAITGTPLLSPVGTWLRAVPFLPYGGLSLIFAALLGSSDFRAWFLRETGVIPEGAVRGAIGGLLEPATRSTGLSMQTLSTCTQPTLPGDASYHMFPDIGRQLANIVIEVGGVRERLMSLFTPDTSPDQRIGLSVDAIGNRLFLGASLPRSFEAISPSQRRVDMDAPTVHWVLGGCSVVTDYLQRADAVTLGLPVPRSNVSFLIRVRVNNLHGAPAQVFSLQAELAFRGLSTGFVTLSLLYIMRRLGVVPTLALSSDAPGVWQSVPLEPLPLMPAHSSLQWEFRVPLSVVFRDQGLDVLRRPVPRSTGLRFVAVTSHGIAAREVPLPLSIFAGVDDVIDTPRSASEVVEPARLDELLQQCGVMSDISPVEDLIGSLDGSVPSAESFRGTGFTTIRGMPGAAPSMTVSEMLLALLRP